MRLIVIGTEYTGKSTLANGLHKWGQDRGIRYHMDDHFTIPDQQTLKDPADQEIMNTLSETMKERFQRFQLAYHVRLMHKYENILLVGYHIEEAVYGHRYYYPEHGKSFETPQSWEKEMPSDTILVLLTANSDVIKQRMKNDPHTYSLVPESDIEDVQKEFEQEFRHSWLQKRFQIDTSDLTSDQLLDAFLKQSLPYLNTKDLLFRQTQS